MDTNIPSIKQGSISPEIISTQPSTTILVPNTQKALKHLKELFEKTVSGESSEGLNKEKELSFIAKNSISLLEDVLKQSENIFRKLQGITNVTSEILSSKDSETTINKEELQKSLQSPIEELDEDFEALGLKSVSLSKTTTFALSKIPDCSGILNQIQSLQEEIQKLEKEASEKNQNKEFLNPVLDKRKDFNNLVETISKLELLVEDWLKTALKLIEKNECRLFNAEHTDSVSHYNNLSTETIKRETQKRERQIQSLKNSYDMVAHHWFQIIEMRDQIDFDLKKNLFREKTFCTIAQHQEGVQTLLDDICQSVSKLEDATPETLQKIYETQENNAIQLLERLQTCQSQKANTLQTAAQSFYELDESRKELEKRTKIRFEKLKLYNSDLTGKIAENSIKTEELINKDFENLTGLYHKIVDETAQKEASCLIKKRELDFEIEKAKVCDKYLKDFAKFNSDICEFSKSVTEKQETFSAETLSNRYKEFREESDKLHENAKKSNEGVLQSLNSGRDLFRSSFKGLSHFDDKVVPTLEMQEEENNKILSEKISKTDKILEENWVIKLKTSVDDLSTVCVQYLIGENQKDFSESIEKYSKQFEKDKWLEKENQQLTGLIQDFKLLYRNKTGKLEDYELQNFTFCISTYNQNCSALNELDETAFKTTNSSLQEKSSFLKEWTEKLNTYESSIQSSNLKMCEESSKEQSKQLKKMEIVHNNLWSSMNLLFGPSDNQQSFAYSINRIQYAINNKLTDLCYDKTFGYTWSFSKNDYAVTSPSESQEKK